MKPILDHNHRIFDRGFLVANRDTWSEAFGVSHVGDFTVLDNFRMISLPR